MGLTESARIARLESPAGRSRVVIDTDAANEIDDQFALAYALLSPERVALEAVYAAPFQRHGSTPAEGMAASYGEIRRVLGALGEDRDVRRGADGWLPAADRPVPSPAAEDLISRAGQAGDPLYVVALGAPTNVASALLMAPQLTEHIVVVWLGGNGSWWIPAAEFNLYQDPHASRVLLDCGVPLVHVPCRQVTEKLATTAAEIERRVRGRGRVGDYLAELYASSEHARQRRKELWDVGPVGWLTHPEWTDSALVPSPLLTGDLRWAADPHRHLIREIRDVDADAILDDLFTRLPPG